MFKIKNLLKLKVIYFIAIIYNASYEILSKNNVSLIYLYLWER
jgi:hypothetical protein